MKKLRIILSNEDDLTLCFEKDDEYLEAFNNLTKAIEMNLTFFYDGLIDEVVDYKTITAVFNPAHIIAFCEVKE